MLVFAAVIVVLIIIIYILTQSLHGANSTHNLQRAQRFYEVADTYPLLADIPHEDVLNEVSAITKPTGQKDWVDWPEKDLWDAGNTGARWTVFPLIAFGRRVDRNCARMPKLMKFISEIDREYSVNIAILSRLGPGMKLVPHQGWGAHSNNVLRCHYGLMVPKVYNSASPNKPIRDCRIEVADEITDMCECILSKDAKGNAKGAKNSKCAKCYDGYVYESRQHRTGEWIIFDDSKMHMAENTTSGDRIVLIMDIVRPDWVPLGTSRVEDTTELKSIIEEYSLAKD